MKRNRLEEFYINLKRNNINETILKEIEKEMRGEWKMKKEIENLLNSEILSTELKAGDIRG